MVSSTDHDLEVVWNDFPKGLRVLLLDEDEISAAETKLKLEAMDYIVFSYHNEKEAVEAIYNKAESFHLAIVEVTSLDSHGSFKFLEIVRDLPTIAISEVHCLSTMMKCIAFGAVEFLQKPLSEEKLRNIWQHVVHKVFNAGGDGLSKSLQPIKKTVVSMLQLRSDTTELRIDLPNDTKTMNKDHEESKHDDDSEKYDKFPAPSTPQLVKGGRLMDDGCCQDPQKCSKYKDLSDNANYSYSKSVDNATNNLPIVVNNNNKDVLISNQKEDAVEEEVTSDNRSKTDECSSIKSSSQASLNMLSGENVESSVEYQKKRKSFPCSNKSRRKMKVDWTPDLHRKFVQAVEQLGIDQAIPSKILELMNVEGLTRHNIASHLQKYRMNRRHILPKDDKRIWQHKDSFPSVYMQKPVTVLPPPSQIYPLWAHPSYYTPGAQMCFSTWQPHQRSWPWKTHTGIHADAWGCPVMPPYSQFAIPSQNTFQSNGLDASESRSKVSKELYGNNLAEEVIDGVVKEAISKPWLPLPLGLKPPSIDSVLTELQRHGICSIPPTIRRC